MQSQHPEVVMILLMYFLPEGMSIDVIEVWQKKITDNYKSVEWDLRMVANQPILFLLIPAKKKWPIEALLKPVFGLPRKQLNPQNQPELVQMLKIIQLTSDKFAANLPEEKITPEQARVIMNQVLNQQLLKNYLELLPSCVAI